MRLASIPVALALVAIALSSCDSGGNAASDTSIETATLTTGATTSTVATRPPPPPLTHRQFIRRLDHLCRVGNRVQDRKFKDKFPENIYDTSESMDAYAQILSKANRYVRRWDRTHHFFGLDPGDPKDIRNYSRYEKLTLRLRNYENRIVVAARHHNFEEIRRLLTLDERTRNKRTTLTADMGLRFCGA